jgi:biofilm protein TabA
MIYDVLENGHFYFAASSRLAKAIEYIRAFDILQPDGQYEIEGKHMYAIVSSYETKPAEQQITESHKKYIDVQAILSGRERIDVALDSEALVINKPYDNAKDAVFYKAPVSYVPLVMTEGTFAVFYPQDVHRPCCDLDGTGDVRKIVVKITLV